VVVEVVAVAAAAVVLTNDMGGNYIENPAVVECTVLN
jgi:hypothetical protein